MLKIGVVGRIVLYFTGAVIDIAIKRRVNSILNNTVKTKMATEVIILA